MNKMIISIIFIFSLVGCSYFEPIPEEQAGTVYIDISDLEGDDSTTGDSFSKTECRNESNSRISDFDLYGSDSERFYLYYLKDFDSVKNVSIINIKKETKCWDEECYYYLDDSNKSKCNEILVDCFKDTNSWNGEINYNSDRFPHNYIEINNEEDEDILITLNISYTECILNESEVEE